jgi:hypothetical protein
MTEQSAVVTPVWVLDAMCLPSPMIRQQSASLGRTAWTSHGTIWLLAGACRDGKLSESAAGNLVDALRATGLRLPCTGAEFPAYARQYGLM